jgi:enoyl-CoA hydratase/carnithine racemase
MKDHEFRFERGDAGVAVLTLDRPATLNALTLGALNRLEQLFSDLDGDETVKAVVLTGAGRGFCSGACIDGILGPLLESDIDAVLEFTRLAAAVVRNMLRLGKPIVAAVNGVAAGGGAVLALASDLRVMAQSANFAFLFAKVGLTGADMGAAWLLPRVVGTGRAMELLLLGDPIGADEALRCGLANRVCADGEALDEAMRLAHRLAAGPGLALATTKRLVHAEWAMDFAAAIEQEAQAQALMLRTHDHREFYNAWMEGRPARFLGR